MVSQVTRVTPIRPTRKDVSAGGQNSPSLLLVLVEPSTHLARGKCHKSSKLKTSEGPTVSPRGLSGHPASE